MAIGYDTGFRVRVRVVRALLKNVESIQQGTKKGEQVEREWSKRALSMHGWPILPTRSIATRPGPLLAAAETFLIEIIGKGGGGHAAMPHLTRDPAVVTASSLIMNLQTIVSRTLSPLESGVVSVCVSDSYFSRPCLQCHSCIGCDKGDCEGVEH